MAEVQGTISAANQYGLKLQNIEGPAKGWFNYSKPEYRDAQWDAHGKGDAVVLTITDDDRAFIKAIRNGGITQSWQQPTGAGDPSPQQWQQGSAQPSPDPIPFPAQGIAPPWWDRDVIIGREVCVKAAVELWASIDETLRGKTPEAAAQDVAAIARILRTVIEE